MIHPSTKKLIDKLGDMTAQRKISWAEGEDGAVVYDTEGYRVSLAGSPTEVILADALGKELDKADHGELSATVMEDGTSYAAYVEQLHKEAGRIARGAEHAIDAVLAGLDLDGDGIPDIDPEIAQDIEEAEAELEVEAIAETVSDDPQPDPEPVVEYSEEDSTVQYDDTSVSAEAPDENSYAENEPDVSQAVKDLAKQVNSAEPAPQQPAPQFSSNYGMTSLSTGTAAIAAGLGMSGDETPEEVEAAEAPEPYQPTQIIPDEQVPGDALAEAAATPLSEEEQNIANILDTVIGDDGSEAQMVDEPAPEPPVQEQPAEAAPAPSYLSQVSVFEAPIVSATSGSPALGVSGFGALPETVQPSVQAPVESTAEAVGDAVSDASDQASEMADAAGDAAGGTLDSMQEAASDVTEAASEAIESGTEKVGGMLGGIGGAIGGMIGGAKDKAQGALEAVTDKTGDEDGEPELGPDGKPKPRFNPWR